MAFFPITFYETEKSAGRQRRGGPFLLRSQTSHTWTAAYLYYSHAMVPMLDSTAPVPAHNRHPAPAPLLPAGHLFD